MAVRFSRNLLKGLSKESLSRRWQMEISVARLTVKGGMLKRETTKRTLKENRQGEVRKDSKMYYM
jgi:hypothetical protein